MTIQGAAEAAYQKQPLIVCVALLLVTGALFQASWIDSMTFGAVTGLIVGATGREALSARTLTRDPASE